VTVSAEKMLMPEPKAGTMEIALEFTKKEPTATTEEV
jgi:hypothetical protein